MTPLSQHDDPFTAEAFAAADLEAEAGPFYTRSNGVKTPLKGMAFPHLKSALAKLERDNPGHPEINDMAAEVARRDAEYAIAQAEKEAAQ